MSVAFIFRNMTTYGVGIALHGMNRRMRLVKGVDCVADDLICRLSQRCWYASEYGLPILNSLNTATRGIGTLGVEIESELLKDERVANCTANVTFNQELLTLNIEITLSGGETFTLVGKPINELATSDIMFSVA